MKSTSEARFKSDDGAMLVVALIIITTVAVVTAAVATHASTNSRATSTIRSVAGYSYAADAAANAALDQLRLGSLALPTPADPAATYPGCTSANLATCWVFNKNTDGSGCFGKESGAPKNSVVFRDTAGVDGFYPRSGSQASPASVRVDCAPVPGTGLFGAGGGVDVDSVSGFKRAITVMDGNLTVTDNSVMQIRGGIAVNGNVAVASNAGLFTNGPISATGSCGSGVITSTPAPQCNRGASGAVSDPVSPDVINSLAALSWKDPAAQGCNFSGGIYDDATGLEAAVRNCRNQSRGAEFAPGIYYFDFHNSTSDPMHTDALTGNNVWDIDSKLIAGTPASGDTVPGACVSPLDDPDALGVQFVFGGSSSMRLLSGAEVEICGRYEGDSFPVSVRQQTDGEAIDLKRVDLTAGTVTRNSSPASTVSATGVTSEDALKATDGTTLQWSAGSGNTRNFDVSLSGWGPIGDIPQGSMLRSARLEVVARATGAGANDKFVVTSTASPSTASQDVTLPLGTVFPNSPQTVDLTGFLSDDVREGKFSATSPKVRLTLLGGAKNMQIAIDSVRLRLDYYKPTRRAFTGGDFLIQDSESFDGYVVLQGATYAPNGRIAVKLGNQADVVAFRWGIVAKSLEIDGHPQVPYGYPVVSIPDDGRGLGRRVTVVDLTVSICATGGACASGGDKYLVVRAVITDPPWPLGSKPTPGRRKVQIVSWSSAR